MAKNTTPKSTESETTAELPVQAEPKLVRLPRRVEINGESYEPGDTVTINGILATVVESKALPASKTSRVDAGTYPVVTVKQGNGTAYRAVVNGELYPIRQWGTENETIAKNRESSGKPRKSRKGFTPAVDHDEEEVTSLSDEADSILHDYLGLKNETDRGEVLSDLIVAHLKPEVLKMKATRAAIDKLPSDLLSKLAGADAETRQKVLALLG